MNFIQSLTIKPNRATIPCGDENYVAFAQRCGNGYMFGRALHFFCVADENEYHDAALRNRAISEIWRDSRCDFFFAEDVFGNLYGSCQGAIDRLDIESGKWENMAIDFREFYRVVCDRPNYYTGEKVLNEWESKNGELREGFRLRPKLPFVAGGEYIAENLFADHWRDNLRAGYQLYVQIRNLPDGTPVEIHFRRKSEPMSQPKRGEDQGANR